VVRRRSADVIARAVIARAFARHGGRTYSRPESDRALALSVDFFNQHLRG
jgi:hypothetical protein